MTDGRLSRPRALFLDLDGTLADTLPAMRLAYDAFLASCGRSGNDDEFRALNGPALPEIVARLAMTHELEPRPEELERRYRGLIAEHYLLGARPAVGARELLACARRLRLPVLVVTSAERALAEGFLARHALAGEIAAVVTPDGLPRSKPDPAIYLRALSVARLRAHEAWAVEDSPNGLRAALAAGVPCFVVGSEGQPDHAEPELSSRAAGRLAQLGDLVAMLEAAR